MTGYGNDNNEKERIEQKEKVDTMKKLEFIQNLEEHLKL